MFAFIKGNFVQRKEDSIVIENSGIGYKIFCPPSVQERIGKLNEQVCVYTYHYVREDTNALYGFPSPVEHDLFILLLQVTGIGPKVAASLSGSIPPSEFALAVITGDTNRLIQIKGVGKKVAERIILELKDKLKGFAHDMDGMEECFAGSDATEAAGGITVICEAVSALVVLGYSGPQAMKAAKEAYNGEIKTEELIRKALRLL